MQFYTSHTPHYSSNTKRLIIWTAAFVVFVLGLLIYSKTAHAGLVSYVNDLFGSSHVSAKVPSSPAQTNSQTVALLQAATHYDPRPEKSSDTSPIVGNVLVPDITLSEYAVPDTTSTKISSYVVRDGDTISGIAQMFDVSVNTIMWANNISRATSLRTGQTLIILPVTGIRYTVKSGDTIKGIVSTYKADTEEVLRYNDLSLNDALRVGQIIIIPDVEVPVPVPTSRSVAGSNPAHHTDGPSYPGYYARPVVGGVRTQGLHGHNGIDIAAVVGTPIYASAPGTVIVSTTGGWNGGYGNLVIISHDNGTQTVYSHNSKNLVTVGQYVDRGDKIALMGATGKATGSHVHFEIRGARNPF